MTMADNPISSAKIHLIIFLIIFHFSLYCDTVNTSEPKPDMSKMAFPVWVLISRRYPPLILSPFLILTNFPFGSLMSTEFGVIARILLSDAILGKSGFADFTLLKELEADDFGAGPTARTFVARFVLPILTSWASFMGSPAAPAISRMSGPAFLLNPSTTMLNSISACLPPALSLFSSAILLTSMDF